MRLVADRPENRTNRKPAATTQAPSVSACRRLRTRSRLRPRSNAARTVSTAVFSGRMRLFLADFYTCSPNHAFDQQEQERQSPEPSRVPRRAWLPAIGGRLRLAGPSAQLGWADAFDFPLCPGRLPGNCLQ